MGGFDGWKADDSSACKHEAQTERDQYEREALAEFTPRYRLHVWTDPWLKLTTARLYVERFGGGWSTLDETTVAGDDHAAAVRCMRRYRRGEL